MIAGVGSCFRLPKEQIRLVPQRMTLSNPPTCKVSAGTFAAALAAFGMAVLGHFMM